MKVLSFDVGIKNLAYCLINKKEDNFKIEDWGIINLDDERKKCTSITKRKKICSKTATHSYLFDGKLQYYCKKCKNNYEKPNFITSNINSEEKCTYNNKNNNICNRKAKNIIEGITGFYCPTHCKMIINSKLKEMGPKKLSDQNCNKIPIQILATKLYSNLDKKQNFLTANEILIENQPTFINPTMKTISALLYGYFCIKGITEKHLTHSNIEFVKFFSPSNKLKVNKEHTEIMLNEGKDKDKDKDKDADAEVEKNVGENKTKKKDKKIYDITKDLGEAYCLALIKEDIEKLNFINSQEKKDDLCDSFLQAFFYLFCNNQTIPEKYKLILDKISSEIKTVDQLKKKTSKKNNIIIPKEENNSDNKKEKKIIVKGKKKIIN